MELYVPRSPALQAGPLSSELSRATDSSILGASLVTQWVKTACITGDWGSIPGSGRYPGEGNGNPLLCSCLENSTDRGARRASPWGCRVRHNLATDSDGLCPDSPRAILTTQPLEN